jgi:hypothetical protein
LEISLPSTRKVKVADISTTIEKLTQVLKTKEKADKAVKDLDDCTRK